MKPILEVRNLWKEYKIGSKQERYKSLRDNLTSLFKAKPSPQAFWALQDINFDVYEGDCIGIIGRNGAGKSTLLKILSKITPPTKGYIKARGRIASLLEVGTGFHPELTGRENIYLNGSILGLRKSEIDRKFDEIVDFSGVEQFLDTPLKHYSSGMQLRLAFSVAAHLEPEILLIDEVLAVGDAIFQKKCLGKMGEVSKSGRTVIFVSHNLSSIESLCSKSCLIRKGKIISTGETSHIIHQYLKVDQRNEKIYDSNSPIKFLKIIQKNEKIILTAQYNVSVSLKIPSLGFVIYSQLGYPIFGYNPTLDHTIPNVIYPNKGQIEVSISTPLLDGIYDISIWFGDGYSNFFEDKNCLQISINNMTKNRQLPPKDVGYIMPNCSYKFHGL